MTAQLNHTIVYSSDRVKSARFHNDGGRGVYFPDPDGHDLEVITRPYGAAGTKRIRVISDGTPKRFGGPQ